MNWMTPDTSKQDKILREFHAQPEARDAVRDLARALQVLGEELAGLKRAVRGDAATFPVYVEGTPRDLHPILWDAVNRIAEGCCVTRSARAGAANRS